MQNLSSPERGVGELASLLESKSIPRIGCLPCKLRSHYLVRKRLPAPYGDDAYTYRIPVLKEERLGLKVLCSY